MNLDNCFSSFKSFKRFAHPTMSVFVCLLILLAAGINQKCLADEQKVTLNVLEPGLRGDLMLKNDQAFRDFYFARPQTWKINSGTALVLKFNHSNELLPERSYIQVFVNGQKVKQEPLDKSSLNTKTITIPIPPGAIGDYNTVRIQVEQHYTYKCEDPLDPSLWTSVKAESYIDYKYNIVQPKVDLAKYPFPLFDQYTYSFNEVNFVVPDLFDDSAQTINALGIIAADIAQKISWHKQKFTVSRNIKPNVNNVIIGTPTQNQALRNLGRIAGVGIKNVGGNFVFADQSGAPVNDTSGVIVFTQNPANKNYALLIVSGNTPEAVNQAARYLANDSIAKNLKGNVAIANEYNPPNDSNSKMPQYVYNSSVTFEQLGLKDQKSERIGPPPLEYPIRVIPDMNTTKKNLALNLIYSYGPKMNEEFSGMEVIFNGITLGNARLNNPNGETDRNLQVDVPAQYVKPFNKLQVKFHLFPHKYGYCQDYYERDFWASVSSKSQVILPSDAKILLPDLSLLNDAYYPYTTAQDLSKMAVIVPRNASLSNLSTLVQVVGAIAATTDSDAGIKLVTSYDNVTNTGEYSSRNLILIGDERSNKYIGDLAAKLFIKFSDYFKTFTPNANSNAELAYSDIQGIIQQISSTFGDNNVMTILYGKNEASADLTAQAFTNRDFMMKFVRGNLYLLYPNEFKQVTVNNKVKTTRNASSDQPATQSVPGEKEDDNSTLFFWLKIAGAVLVGFVLLRVIFNALFGRKG